ncbi:hypothetical protein FLA_4492 [Filimonas lacunae]|nr:hypothetical protein FLA_4492 [Filimonas lacunae]
MPKGSKGKFYTKNGRSADDKTEQPETIGNEVNQAPFASG